MDFLHFYDSIEIYYILQYCFKDTIEIYLILFLSAAVETTK